MSTLGAPKHRTAVLSPTRLGPGRPRGFPRRDQRFPYSGRLGTSGILTLTGAYGMEYESPAASHAIASPEGEFFHSSVDELRAAEELRVRV